MVAERGISAIEFNGGSGTRRWMTQSVTNWFYEDFETGNSFTLEAGTAANRVTGSELHGTILQSSGTNNSITPFGYSTGSTTWNGNVTVSGWFSPHDNAALGHWFGEQSLFLHVSGAWTESSGAIVPNNGYKLRFYNPSNGTEVLEIIKISNGNETILNSVTSFEVTDNSEYVLIFRAFEDGSLEGKIFSASNTNTSTSVSATDTTFTGGQVGFSSEEDRSNSYAEWDEILVSDYHVIAHEGFPNESNVDLGKVPWEFDPGEEVGLFLSYSTQGAPLFSAVDEISVDAAIPNGSSLTTTHDFTIDGNQPTGFDFTTFTVGSDPFNATPGVDKSGTLELVLQVNDTGGGWGPYNSRGTGSSAGTPTEQQGYVRSPFVVNAITESNVAIDGAEPTSWAFPDEVYSKIDFVHEPYESFHVDLLHQLSSQHYSEDFEDDSIGTYSEDQYTQTTGSNSLEVVSDVSFGNALQFNMSTSTTTVLDQTNTNGEDMVEGRGSFYVPFKNSSFGDIDFSIGYDNGTDEFFLTVQDGNKLVLKKNTTELQNINIDPLLDGTIYKLVLYLAGSTVVGQLLDSNDNILYTVSKTSELTTVDNLFSFVKAESSVTNAETITIGDVVSKNLDFSTSTVGETVRREQTAQDTSSSKTWTFDQPSTGYDNLGRINEDYPNGLIDTSYILQSTIFGSDLKFVIDPSSLPTGVEYSLGGVWKRDELDVDPTITFQNLSLGETIYNRGETASLDTEVHNARSETVSTSLEFTLYDSSGLFEGNRTTTGPTYSITKNLSTTDRATWDLTGDQWQFEINGPDTSISKTNIWSVSRKWLFDTSGNQTITPANADDAVFTDKNQDPTSDVVTNFNRGQSPFFNTFVYNVRGELLGSVSTNFNIRQTGSETYDESADTAFTLSSGQFSGANATYTIDTNEDANQKTLVIADGIAEGTNQPRTGTDGDGNFAETNTSTGEWSVNDEYTLTRHLQIDNDALNPSVNVTERLSSQLGFYSIKVTDSAGDPVNGATGSVRLVDDQDLVSPIDVNNATTTTVNSHDGYIPLNAWSSQLPSGGWDLFTTADFTKDGNSGSLSRSGIGTWDVVLEAPKVDETMISGGGPKDLTERLFSPGMAFRAGFSVLNTDTGTITEVSNAMVAITRLQNSGTNIGKVEYLDSNLNWQPIDTSTGTVHFFNATETIPNTSGVFIKDFTANETADWGNLDLFVIAKAEIDGSPIKDKTQIVNTTGISSSTDQLFSLNSFPWKADPEISPSVAERISGMQGLWPMDTTVQRTSDDKIDKVTHVINDINIIGFPNTITTVIEATSRDSSDRPTQIDYTLRKDDGTTTTIRKTITYTTAGDIDTISVTEV